MLARVSWGGGWWGFGGVGGAILGWRWGVWMAGVCVGVNRRCEAGVVGGEVDTDAFKGILGWRG